MPNKTYTHTFTANGIKREYEFEIGDYHRHTWEILDQIDAELLGYVEDWLLLHEHAIWFP